MCDGGRSIDVFCDFVTTSFLCFFRWDFLFAFDVVTNMHALLGLCGCSCLSSAAATRSTTDVVFTTCMWTTVVGVATVVACDSQLECPSRSLIHNSLQSGACFSGVSFSRF